MKLLSRSLWLSLAAACALPVGAIAAPLPDGRAYELVSPAQKNGNMAGAAGSASPLYAVAAAGEGADEGPGVLYGATGPLGVTESGVDGLAVSRRSSTGWDTHAALPRPEGALNPFDGAIGLDPSADLSQIAFSAARSYGLGNPEGEPFGSSGSLYLAGEDGSLQWLSKPLEPSADPQPGHVGTGLAIAGASPDLGTVYFTYYGTLVAEDGTRARVIEENGGANAFDADWGFYEFHEGTLTNAGELPDGTFSPYGAVPAATTSDTRAAPQSYGGEVAADGSEAFFVSPDPQTCAALLSGCEGQEPQLYARVDGTHTVLVSRSEVLAPVQGRPAPAPDGVMATIAPTPAPGESFALASGDGSHVFFASADRLTASAPSGGTYEFDVSNESLSFLPGVSGPVLASSADGSSFVFESTATSPAELELFSGGQITRLATLPTPPVSTTNEGGRLLIGPVRLRADGSVVVFQTDAPIAGFNEGGGFEQVYRYEAQAGTLTCVSCPPDGVTPSGDATLSTDDLPGVGGGRPTDSRGVSADGAEVYLQSPDPLVPQDVNGELDVYESEGGEVKLISSGTSEQSSFFLDNSASGQDVFFAAAGDLEPEDTDGGYDVYDARVGGGFTTVQPPVCTGDCRAAEPAPQVIGPISGSATYPAGENAVSSPVSPKAAVQPKAKGKPKQKAKAKKKPRRAHGKTKSKHARHKRGAGTKS